MLFRVALVALTLVGGVALAWGEEGGWDQQVTDPHGGRSRNLG